MKQSTVNGRGLSQMCRLCLTRNNVAMADVFSFSSKFEKKIADIIMECTPVQITRYDKMPTYICRLCSSQLEKFYQFQMQAVQTDKILRHYLKKLNDSGQTIKHEWILESDDPVNHNSNADITVNCDPLEMTDELDEYFYSKQKGPEKIFLKSEIKDGSVDGNLIIESQSTDDTVRSSCNINDSEIDSKINNGVGTVESSFKFESVMIEEVSGNIKEKCNISIKEELDDNLLFSVECTDSIVNTSSNITSKEDKNEDRNIDISDIKIADCHRSIEDLKGTEHSGKHENLNKMLHQCNVCQKCFKKPAHLKRHILIHTGEKPYQCDICKKYFREPGTLKKHNLIHTEEKPYQCNICKMCFKESSTLKKHNLIHTEEKPYQCDVCKMCFKESSTLKKHNVIHTGERPYQCDICQMCFSYSTSLNRHKLIHKGQKPYQCDICEMCFRESSNLKQHRLIHTGEKPHQCNVCKMRFRQSAHLRRHGLIHAGVKPYQCNICKKYFRESSTLKKHELIHT